MVEDDGTLKVRSIWLLLLKEGGRWGAGEIAETLGADTDTVCRVVGNMASRGFIKKFPRTDSRKHIQYAVDKNCGIPKYLTVADLCEAGVEL